MLPAYSAAFFDRNAFSSARARERHFPAARKLALDSFRVNNSNGMKPLIITPDESRRYYRVSLIISLLSVV